MALEVVCFTTSYEVGSTDIAALSRLQCQKISQSQVLSHKPIIEASRIIHMLQMSTEVVGIICCIH
jgi:hypothetical protein